MTCYIYRHDAMVILTKQGSWIQAKLLFWTL